MCQLCYSNFKIRRAAIIIFFILALFLVFIWQKPAQIYLWLWGVSLDINKFKLTNITKETLEAQKENIFLKIQKTKIDNHQKFIDDKIYLLKSLFEPVTSPYPEVLSNVILCPLEFKPKEEVLQNGRVFTLFAGERFGFGVCSQDLVKYQTIYGIFDCGSRGVFEVSLFGKRWEDLEPIIKSFSCKNG